MKIINGKKIAKNILAELKKQIRAKKIKPCLGVVLAGKNPASLLYVKLKESAGRKIGGRIKKYFLDENVSEKEIIKIIKELNEDRQVNGILVQFPLPAHICADKVIKSIEPLKDVDGFLKNSPYEPPFILSIWHALKETKADLKNKNIIALVNSEIFGEALKNFFKKRQLKLNYFIKPKKQGIKKADVIITALGKPHYIKSDMIKKDVILIDGGISKIDEKVAGDIDIKSVKKKASWITPVPGGLGPMTIAYLLKNVIIAAENFSDL